MKDQMKVKECSHKAKLEKDKQKKQTLFDCFKKVTPQENTKVELDSESNLVQVNLSRRINGSFFKFYHQY